MDHEVEDHPDEAVRRRDDVGHLELGVTLQVRDARRADVEGVVDPRDTREVPRRLAEDEAELLLIALRGGEEAAETAGLDPFGAYITHPVPRPTRT